ncbi:hypothetical protein B0H19DRAFT_1253641 [Mycena capillaripes]|nr:hypothetical protein B0H19DRAFT_1253641 [Mycena capillaripes]
MYSASLIVDVRAVMPQQASQLHTVNRTIYAGEGGTGGQGGVQGGGWDAGEGPLVYYDFAKVENVTVNNVGSQQLINAVEHAQIIDWLSQFFFFQRQADILQAQQDGTGGPG